MQPCSLWVKPLVSMKEWETERKSSSSPFSQDLVRQNLLLPYFGCVNTGSLTKLCLLHTHTPTHTLFLFLTPVLWGLVTRTMVSLRASQPASLPAIQLIPAATDGFQRAWSANHMEEWEVDICFTNSWSTACRVGGHLWSNCLAASRLNG